ncbi:MAG: hypothetical protein CMI90_06550 [Pelagibacteraceae bacterium]|nr:hypothetical protein [Pelagibacteraceae bacterium]
MKIDYIFIVGSSGGHILPSISLINKFKNYNKNIILFTNQEGLVYKNLINNSKCKIKVFNEKNKFKLILSQLIFSFSFMKLNSNIKIVGFGGFISITPIIFFWLSRLFLIKNEIFIHEQNIIYGSANKINYFFCDNSFISFPKNKLKKKEIYIGNYFNILPKKISLKEQKSSKYKILLIGGSGGSVELNDFLLKFIDEIPDKEIDNYEFFVQIPKYNSSLIKEKYKKRVKNINFFNFDNNLDFKSYDLIFSRSGSGSLFEILYLTNKVIFVPHLHSRDQHQKYNKNFFKNNKCLLKDSSDILSINNNLYFNKFINPYSINKLLSFIKN